VTMPIISTKDQGPKTACCQNFYIVEADYRYTPTDYASLPSLRSSGNPRSMGSQVVKLTALMKGETKL
jgi:hypothetical protein